jgi:hypothetical protein
MSTADSRSARVQEAISDRSDAAAHASRAALSVVSIEGARFGLSRNYRLGFTYAPFGNPLSVVHFLAWHHAPRPLNMNRTPVTFSDLVEMTRRINTSIVEFFAGAGVNDYKVIDGVSIGWAGNTIYHQHFQFFQPEYPAPIRDRALLGRGPLPQLLRRLRGQRRRACARAHPEPVCHGPGTRPSGLYPAP